MRCRAHSPGSRRRDSASLAVRPRIVAAVLSHLLSPLRVGPVELRNRVVSTAHQTTLVDDHLPTEDFIAYHAARARGGTGAIFLEATAIDPTGLLTPHTLGGYLPSIVDGYARVAEAVESHGTRLFVQLFHGGRELFGGAPRAPAVAPSAVPSPRFHSEPRALTRREIAGLVRGYAVAAAHAQRGRLDGVEVSMAHGYLPSQFFSRRSNRRDDTYGGALDTRMRFALEILEAIRAQVGGDLAVGVRLAASEMAPDTEPADVADEIRARICDSGLVDFVSLALGHSASYRGSTYIAPPAPVPEDVIAQHLRADAGEIAVIATTRVVDLEHAEAIVASGRAHAVGMTRALIADPDVVAKAAEGRAAEIIECIGCNQACIGHYHAGLPIGCVVNPRTGRERRFPPLRRERRRVLVVGAGPAGITAAVEARRAGDDVRLIEREEDIGGQLALAGRAPGHAESWRRFARTARRNLERTGVSLELGTEAGAELAERFDRVILATGAQPYEPPVGDAPFAIVHAWDAIRAPGKLAGPVLVADWGGEWAGLDAAEVLAGAGLEVTLACAATVPGETLHQYQRNSYLGRLDDAGVRVRHHLELARPADALVLRHVFSGRTEPLGDVATLVLAQGRRPRDELWLALEGRPGVSRVGDVLGPRTAEEAILEGFLAGREGPERGHDSSTPAEQDPADGPSVK
jgi:2,4-dienoyl-CoA reductase-like NADH-dependent reductase (Old Yellow Enzyme family)